ncbi:hypothetical protein AcW2_006973 [Taiwanofungus camphoratus]|nr:hypothetical protein AcW2_006973 [Antrodia cinnamomea]
MSHRYAAPLSVRGYMNSACTEILCIEVWWNSISQLIMFRWCSGLSQSLAFQGGLPSALYIERLLVI